MRIRPAILLLSLAGAALCAGAGQDALTLTPGPRHNHGMTYDARSGLVLLFGGMNVHERLGDLWAWDGRSWRRLSNSGPAPRDRAVFAYDSKRGRTILFGGSGASENLPEHALDDTWEWDGVAWTEKPVSGPSLRHPIGAYDKRRERLVVYGGLSTTGETRAPWPFDTWEWDGERWSRRSNAAVDGAPDRVMYDERRKQVVMVAVESAAQPDGTPRSALWCWDGLQWQRVTDARGSPPLAAPEGILKRAGYALAYDTRRKRVVLFGGTAGFAEGRTGEMFGDTWEWTGTAWVRMDKP